MQTSPRRYQQLQPEDRVTMASLLQQNHSLRDIAAVLNRSPSTISREPSPKWLALRLSVRTQVLPPSAVASSVVGLAAPLQSSTLTARCSRSFGCFWAAAGHLNRLH